MKMSRAKDQSTVYVVADSAEQAAEDLRRNWKVERRLTWVIDRPEATDRTAGRRRDVDAALRRGGLLAERHAILASVPADPTAAIRAAELELDRLRRQRADLETGRGSYANHRLNRAVIAHDEATRNVTRLQGNLTRGRLPRRERREEESELARWRVRAAVAAKTLAEIRVPEQRHLDSDESKVGADLAGLHGQRLTEPTGWPGTQRQPVASTASNARSRRSTSPIVTVPPGTSGVTPGATGRGCATRRSRTVVSTWASGADKPKGCSSHRGRLRGYRLVRAARHQARSSDSARQGGDADDRAVAIRSCSSASLQLPTVRMPSLGVDFWELESGEARHEEAPQSFHIPPRPDREALRPGQHAKLLFMLEGNEDDGSVGLQVERMWVVVAETLTDGVYIGLLEGPTGVVRAKR